MVLDPFPRVPPPAVEARLVDAVQAEELGPALLDVTVHALDDPPVLVVEEAAEPRREGQHPGPRPAEDQEFHVAPEERGYTAIPGLRFSP